MDVETESAYSAREPGLGTRTPGSSSELMGKGDYTWRFTVGVRESHGSHIYCGDLTSVDDEQYLATVGKNRASVYVVKADGDIDLIQAWDDEDTEEVYYTCAFTADNTTGDTWLAAAGKRGIIKVINLTSSTVSWLIGHGNEVNHFVWHPVRECILLSASKDESIRLWNVKNRTLIAIFAGRGGHRYDVLSIAFHPSGMNLRKQRHVPPYLFSFSA
jgi:polycomb protein EED